MYVKFFVLLYVYTLFFIELIYFSVKINVKVLLHIDVNGGLLPTGSSSPDYIDPSLS